MEWTGTLSLCRQLPLCISIERISFLRRSLEHDNLNDTYNFEPLDEEPDPAYYLNRQPPNSNSPVPQRKRTPIGFTYLVVARLAPMRQSDLLTLLDFIYNMKFQRNKGYIAVYKQSQPNPPGSPKRPCSQLVEPSSPTSSLKIPIFSRKNTL